MSLKIESEPLLSPKHVRLITDPINKNNPITVLVLGICSALAVTVKLEPSVVMALSVVAVITLANVITSVIRNTIPPRIRIIVQLVIIASLVILVDEILKAFVYDISKQLSVFVGLIITNCIIMGRLEAFALNNKPYPALLDGFGNGIGYGIILIIVGFFRELFGSGTIWDYPVIPESFYIANGGFYENNGLFILPPMALIIVGVIIWVQRYYTRELIEESN